MARKFGNPPAQQDPLAYTDVGLATTPTVDFKNRNPGILDKGFPIQTIGRNSVTLDEFILVGFNSSGAIWVKFTGGTGDVITISDTLGAKVDPDNTGDIQLEAGAGISVISDDANDKLTITALAGGGGIGMISTDDGAPEVPPDGANILTMAGGVGMDVNGNGPGTTVTVNLESPVIVANGGTGNTTLTDGGIMLGSAAGAVTVLAQAGDGEIPIGFGGADPTLATISQGPGIEVVNTPGVITVNAIPAVVGFSNLGINYDVGSGVFTVTSQSGAALSSTNKSTINLPSKTTPGTVAEYNITANQNFIDDNGASQIINNLFGLATGVEGANIPFFIYAVTNDAENAIQFMLSRVPAMKVSPAADAIGDPASAVADDQADFWSFDNIDQTLFDTNPCLMVGSFRMSMSTLDDWTVQTLLVSDGMGLFQEDVFFEMPIGQFGAASGKFLADNGGTAPAFASNQFDYRINARDQQCFIVLRLENVNVPGIGSATSRVVFPYRGQINNSVYAARFQDDSLANIQIMIINSSRLNHLVSMRFDGATGNFENDEWDTDDGIRITSLITIGNVPL